VFLITYRYVYRKKGKKQWCSVLECFLSVAAADWHGLVKTGLKSNLKKVKWALDSGQSCGAYAQSNPLR